jgi:hypothetical protein
MLRVNMVLLRVTVIEMQIFEEEDMGRMTTRERNSCLVRSDAS